MPAQGNKISSKKNGTFWIAKKNKSHTEKSLSPLSNKHQRRRRLVPPPARLAWPGQVHASGCSSEETTEFSNSQNQLKHEESSSLPSSCGGRPTRPTRDKRTPTANTTTSRPLKRRRYRSEDTARMEADSSSTRSSIQNQLWIEKYRPTKSSEVVVAPNKVKRVAGWLRDEQVAQEQVLRGARLLILTGGPGAGKSTLIRTLAHEQNWDVVEWTESFYEFTARSEIELQRPLAHWQQFLRLNSIGYASLLVSDGNEKGDQKPLKVVNASRRLQNSATPPSQQPKAKKSRLIVLDELPYCNDAESQSTFRESLTQHIMTSNVPTVWIWSQNVLEGKHNPADLEALVEPHVLYNTNLVTILTIQPVTLAKFQSTLKRIAHSENILSELPRDFISELHAQSRGDIRFAINALQYQYSSDVNMGQNNTDAASSTVLGADRDVRLSAFHALGKVLYAKRKPLTTEHVDANTEAPLDFDPERAIEHSGMELGGSIHFLQHHSIDFFTDVSELSVALDLYGDAAILLDCNIAVPAASSLAGRAVAFANHHPAPSKFRPLSKPKSLDVLAKRKTNHWRLDQYYRNANGMPGSPCWLRSRHSRETFATEIYPYGRRIVLTQQRYHKNNSSDSIDGNASLLSSFWGGPVLQSFVAGALDAENSPATANNEEGESWQRDQDEVLRLDDIDEFDDDVVSTSKTGAPQRTHSPTSMQEIR